MSFRVILLRFFTGCLCQLDRPRGDDARYFQISAVLAEGHQAKLKELETKERKFEDVVKSAKQATVLVLVY